MSKIYRIPKVISIGKISNNNSVMTYKGKQIDIYPGDDVQMRAETIEELLGNIKIEEFDSLTINYTIKK